MAGKSKNMSQIKQLLRLHQQGKAKKEIAKALGISKNTVKSYLAKVASSDMNIQALLDIEDPTLEAKLFAGNPSYKDNNRYIDLKDNLSYYLQELKRTGVNRHLLWEEYRQSSTKGYSYSQFCYHLSQYNKSAKPSMVLTHVAGDKLYIDFAGKTIPYINIETGELIECQIFVACLPYSDYGFAMAVRTQSISDFIYSLTTCLKSIGGVPSSLVPDNLKAAIIKANRYEPDVNRVLEDFANHYGTTILPARVQKPQDKALVENQVKLIYSRVYAKLRNQHFFDLSSLNRSIQEKVLAHNQTRMQQKPYCREERFLSDEKHLLKPLPEKEFEIKYYKELKVAKNNHVYLSCDKHYYSVPYAHTGQKTKVIYTRSLVRIYVKGEQVALHIRSYTKGTYTTIKEHLCSQHQHYLDRSPDYYRNKAKMLSQQLFQVVDRLFEQDKYPEQLYRTCDGLFNLHRKTDPELFISACQMAIEYQNYSYRFILNIIQNKMTTNITTQLKIPLPEHNNTRGAGYYK